MPSTSRQSMATGSSPPPVVEEDERGYETSLSTESTDTEVNQDRANWSEREKKLQHLTEFMQNISIFLERWPHLGQL